MSRTSSRFSGDTRRLYENFEPPPCWIRLLKELHNHLDLKTFDIFGVVSTGKCQHWEVMCCCGEEPIADSPCMRSRIRSFVVNGGDFPLDERLAAYAGYNVEDLPDELKETIIGKQYICLGPNIGEELW
jgi:hypothetical protein